MLVEKIVGNLNEEQLEGTLIPVPFAWFEVGKKRIKKVASDGMELGILVEEVLKDGDILAYNKGKYYVCELSPTLLAKIHVDTMQEMGRLCFELGNRHLSLKIEEHTVSIPYDKPTFTYLEKLGFHVTQVEEKFFAFMECKAHGSSAAGLSDTKHIHKH